MKRTIAVLCALLLGLVAPSFGGETLKIGVCMPITGPAAAAGEYAKYGLDLAAEQQNAKGGIDVGGKNYKIQLIYEDNEGKPEISVNAFNKLIGQDEVVAIIGPDMSMCLISAGPVAQSHEIPVIGTTTSNPAVTDVGDYVFRACWIDDYQGLVCAKMARNLLKADTVAVLYSNADDYSMGLTGSFEKEFTAMGGKVVKEAYAGADVRDFNAQLTNIKNAGASVLFLPNQANELPLQIKQARTMGLKLEIMGEMSWDNPNVPELAGNDMVEGCLFISLFAPDNPSPVSKAFTEAFKAKYNLLPNTQSVMSYDSFQIIMDALRRAGTTDGPELRDAIAATDMEVPSGHITFDAKRNPQKSANVMVYRKGVPTYEGSVQ